MSDELLLRTLRQRVLDEIRLAVPSGPVALLDFPNYGNPGDSAIWLGTLSCLSSLGRVAPIYTSDSRSFDERALTRALAQGGTILLQGGGNLGDLWPAAQQFRERVLRAFPEHRVVQLAQTIHFSDRRARADARAAFRRHRDFTILVRDAQSLAIASNELECRARLCPDVAFCLRPSAESALSVSHAASRHDHPLYLLRTDHERADNVRDETPSNALRLDWTSDPRRSVHRMANIAEMWLRAAERSALLTLTKPLARRFLSSWYPRLARRRLRRGCELLCSAPVVVTDRLHAHILGLLLGIPHVVVGDRNGKLRNFIDAWTSSASRLRWAENAREAGRLAEDLLTTVDNHRSTVAALRCS